MKTANFKFVSKTGATGYGKVTLNDDDKISITEISFDRAVSSATKSQLKEYANKIVALDFPSDMCYNFKSTENSGGLIASLFNNTQDLRLIYLDKTKEWAKSAFNQILIQYNWSINDWCKYFNIEAVDNKFPKNFYNTNKAKIYDTLKTQITTVVKMGQDVYISTAIKEAEIHYKNSIIKLASRLNNKGINDETPYTITNTSLGQNFECLITSGNVIVKAWTIIASGEVQRPHYRYLVK